MTHNECTRNGAQGVPTNGGSERLFSLPYGTDITAGVLWPLSRIIFPSSQGPHDVHLTEEKEGGLQSFGAVPMVSKPGGARTAGIKFTAVSTTHQRLKPLPQVSWGPCDGH